MGGIIVNADDFGWTTGVDEAIAELIALGTVSSTSVMVGMPCAAEVEDLMREHPRVGLGVHLTLTEGPPVADPGHVGSLLGSDGRFRGQADFRRHLKRRRIVMAEVERELDAQLSRARDLLGDRLDHWDSHHHIHRFEPLYSHFARCASRAGVRAMRAHKHYWPVPGGEPRANRPGGGVRSRLFEAYYRAELARHRRRFAAPRGILVMTDMAALAELRPQAWSGILEVLAHPATRTAGLEGVTDAEDRVRQYRVLASEPVQRAMQAAADAGALLRFVDL